MNNSPTEGLTCPNPDCRIAETGKCVEGLPVSECPYQQAATAALEDINIRPSTDDELVEDEPVIETERREVQIAGGEILNIEEAADVLRRGLTRVVALIGPIESGKTTFGLSLYSAFQDEPFGRWSFAGSLTLPAFEQRCHLSRIKCGMTIPDTDHTSRGEGLGFLHLATYSAETGRIDLLISDRSGEFYSAVADSQEDCENLHEIPRADLILFLVDGRKLASDERHGVKHDITMMVQALVEGGMIGKEHRVGVVLTKYDQVLSSSVTARTEKDFDGLVENLQRRFGSKLAEINAFRIAARPTNKEVEPRFGVLEILEECMHPRPFMKFVNIKTRVLPLDRWFFRLRQLTEVPNESE